jgi:hypothetical protein
MASFRLRSGITCAFAASILLGEKGWKTLKDFGINDARCKFRAFASFRKSYMDGLSNHYPEDATWTREDLRC